jgi:MFS family permease
VARGFAGVCGANITAAQAYVADVTDEKSRAAGMGTLGAALGLGFVFGPAMGGFLSRYSPTLPFLLAGTLAGVNFVLAAFILDEPRTAAERTHARTLTWDGLARAVSSPRLRTNMILYFIVTFGFAQLEGTFSLYLERRFHYGRREASYLFAYIGVLIVLVQGGFVRRLAPRFGERALVVAGTALMAAGLFVQYIALDLWVLLVGIGVISIGNALNTPSLSSLISRAAGGDQQGGVLGVSQALGALARIAGPLLGTFLLGFGVAVPYAVGGFVLLAACGFAAVAVEQPAK